MQGEQEIPRIDITKLQAGAREARGAGIPIKPPATVQLANPIPMAFLSQINTEGVKTTYALLVEEEDKARNERWLPPSRFSHDL